MDGDVEMCRVIVTGTVASSFAGVAGTGRSFRIDQAVVTHLRDGRVVEAWEIADTPLGAQKAQDNEKHLTLRRCGGGSPARGGRGPTPTAGGGGGGANPGRRSVLSPIAGPDRPAGGGGARPARPSPSPLQSGPEGGKGAYPTGGATCSPGCDTSSSRPSPTSSRSGSGEASRFGHSTGSSAPARPTRQGEAHLRQGRLSVGSRRSLQLQPRRQREARH